MKKKVIYVAILSLMASVPYAQVAPNAGALLNQYKQDSQRNDEPAPVKRIDQQRVFTGFTYDGLSAEQVEQANQITAEYLGKEVSMNALIRYLESQLERRHGISVVFQPQANGTLRAIYPILGAIHIENKSGLNDGILRRTLEHDIELGKPLNRSALEKRSMIANEIPGILNQYRMAPGATEGSTDLYVSVMDGKSVDGYVGVDNNGTTAVGIWEALAGVTLNNLFGIGERISLNGLKTENGQYGGFFADAPVGTNDLRVGVNASIYTYSYNTNATSNTGANLASNYFGGASDLGVNATYAVSRSEFQRTNLTFAYDHKENHSNVDIKAYGLDGSTAAASYKLSNWMIDVINLGYNGLHALPGRATGSYNINASYGHASQKNGSAAISDGVGAKQQGTYAKLNFQAMYSRPFDIWGGEYLFTTSTSGQLSNKNLPNSEKFYVGGLSMMRAWSPQITGGDNAVWLEIKAEKYLTPQIKVGAFAEAAYVSINSTPYTAISPNGTPVSFNEKNLLSDVGLSATYTPIRNLDITGTVAMKTSAIPSAYGMPIATTNNQNGDVMGFVRAMYRF